MSKISASSTKKRIEDIGLQKKVLVKHLSLKGIKTDAILISNVLNEKYTMPKSDVILTALDELLTLFEKAFKEWEDK